MSNLEERFSRLINNAQVKASTNYSNSQSTVERFNRLIDNANQRQNSSPFRRVSTDFNTVQKLIPKYRRQAEEEEREKLEEEARIKKEQVKEQERKARNGQLNGPTFNLPTMTAEETKISQEAIKDKRDKLKKEYGEDSLTTAIMNLQESEFGKTKPGKFIAEALSVGDNLREEILNTANGAINGGLDFLKYANEVGYKLDDKFGSANLIKNTEYGKYLKETNKKTYNVIKNNLNEMQKNVQNEMQEANSIVDTRATATNTKVAKKLAEEIAPSLGNNLVGAGISTINPVAGTAYFIGSAGGSYYEDGLQRGMNNDQALIYGTIAGTMEGVTEMIPVSSAMGAGKNLFKKQFAESLRQLGISVTENFIQEAYMEPLQELSASIGGFDKMNWNNMDERMIQSGIDGAISSIILSGASAGIPSAINIQEKIQSGGDINIIDVQKALKDIQDSKLVDVNAELRNSMSYQIQKYMQNQGVQQENLQKATKKATEQYKTNNYISNLQQNSTINQNTNQQQQISQIENKNSLNQNVEGQIKTKFSKILNNQKLPMQSYIYEKSDNLKIDSLRQQANKYFNNSQEAHNYVDMLEKIITDKNITINFDTNLGNDINGKYENGVITINPNSSRAGEFLAIHELTHAIRKDSMIKMIDNYRKSNAEFDSQVQKLLSKYNQTEINEEALADIAGQLFGNQEYINNLAQTNPNIFKRIYNEIKYLWHQFRGYKNQNQFVDDLMFKWEQAYRNNEQLNNAKYSKQENTNLPKIDYTDDKNLTREVFNKYNTFYSKNQPKEQNRFNDFINKHYSDFNSASNYYVSQAIDNGSLVTMWLNVDDNLVKLTTTKEGNKLYIDELYVEKQKQGTGTKVVNMLKDYANKAGLTIETSKELTTAKGFWDKALNKVSQETTNLPQTDNKGNVLSKQEQEFFKDSAIRVKEINGWDTISKDGKLFEVYHGTNNDDFTIFDSDYIGSSNDTGWYGKGFYFSFTEGEARTYGQNVLKAHLNIKNPFNFSKEMQSYDGVSSGDINFDFGAFLLNLNEKFPDIAKSETIRAEKRNMNKNQTNYTGEINAKDVPLSKLANDIKNVYNSPNLKIIEIDDNGKTKYCYAYGVDVQSYKMPQSIKDLIIKSNIFNYSDAIFAKENMKYYPKVSEQEIDSLVEYFKKNNVDFRTDAFGFEVDNKDQLKEMKLGEATHYVLERMYSYVDRHMPETYMQSFGDRITEELKKQGYDGVIQSEKGDEIVAFYPNQIKRVDNHNPTSNSDIRYSKNSNTWQEYLEKEFPAKGTRTNMQNIKNGVLPTKETINQKKEQNKTETKLPPKVSANNQYKDNTTKVRKHYKSIIESANTTPEAKAIAKELMGTDTYIPETNKGELERADEKIMNSTPESELNSLMSRATVGEKITPVDIAVGERLIQYYSKIGDGAKLQDAIQATAMAGTTAGQTVQAMSLLNHMTPQGQAVWLQRSVDKMNNKLKKTRGKNAQQFTLTDDMLQKIVSSENEKQLAENLDEVYKELGQQVSKSTMEKIDAWRYFSMLANPRTHIRNILGNFAMARVQVLKNKVAGVTEAVVSKANKNMERTHTIVPASKEVRQFAKADINNVTDRLGLTEGKLNPQTRLENNMKTFKHETMNKTIGKLFDLNNKALEVEDGWGLKAGYAKALAEYMTANKLKPDTITDAQLSKARNYAVQQAKEATFHQENQLASLVNQLSNRNKFAKFGVDAVLPFKKTPMNIAKTGIEYSPVGLAKSMVLDTAKLRKGNITVNQYIDNISKGLTGTGIGLVGYVLAEAGILKASGGDDDDKEKYEEGRGKQAFSIQIGDNTYSLDWLAPTAIPLFIGAEISALNKATNETKTSNSSDENSKYNQILKTTTNVLDAFTNSMNPMMEMSMLSGLASTLRSYEQGATQGITAMGTNALKSYVNQFFPTAMGQVAKTMDEYERSTTSTKSGILPKAVDSTKNQIMAKVPGLRQMLPTKTDVWGNDMKQPENVVQRALENAVLPYTRKEVNNNDVDQELVRLYEERGEKAVLPSSSLSKDLTFSGEKYKMTSEEFAKYKKDYGSKSYSLINDLINSSDYNKLSDEDKQQALENVYKYAKEYAKDQYAKANDIDYKKDTMFKTAQEMEKSGNVSSYFNYLAKTDGIKEKEKMNVLVKASYSNNDKKLIYTNTIGSDDSLYNNAMKYTGININEYLKYKQQEFTSDKTDDGTVDGKSVSGSKKAKVYDYVNQMKITGEQRMLLLGTQYKLTNSERAILANYVANLKITKNQKLEIYKKLQGFTVYKDGRVIY